MTERARLIVEACVARCRLERERRRIERWNPSTALGQATRAYMLALADDALRETAVDILCAVALLIADFTTPPEGAS